MYPAVTEPHGAMVREDVDYERRDATDLDQGARIRIAQPDHPGTMPRREG
jgi:hypothetical protein